MSPRDYAEDLAVKLAGNHSRFESFAWFGRPENAEEWCIVYTHNRDSDALDRSNAHVIGKALDPFLTGEDDADCRAESHSHWACGWVEGFAIRVRRSGALTPAFRAYAALQERLEEYPVLDEEHFSDEERTEADNVWGCCYSPQERVAYMRRVWRDFESCQAKWNDPRDAWRNLLACVRGRAFFGCAGDLLSR